VALTNAQKQARWRAKRNALARANPDEIERALLQDVERCERGELSDQDRVALANKLADLAMHHLHRSHALAKVAMKVRYGEQAALAKLRRA
jgi:hypothetical protein